MSERQFGQAGGTVDHPWAFQFIGTLNTHGRPSLRPSATSKPGPWRNRTQRSRQRSMFTSNKKKKSKTAAVSSHHHNLLSNHPLPNPPPSHPLTHSPTHDLTSPPTYPTTLPHRPPPVTHLKIKIPHRATTPPINPPPQSERESEPFGAT